MFFFYRNCSFNFEYLKDNLFNIFSSVLRLSALPDSAAFQRIFFDWLISVAFG